MIPRTMEELEEIRQQCMAMVKRRAALSAFAGALPLPGVDVGMDVAIMMKLLSAINRRFGLSAEQLAKLNPELRAKIVVLATSVGSRIVGKIIRKETVVFLLKKVGRRLAARQMTKIIPIVGSAASATMSFMAMRYIGRAHVNDCYHICRRLIEESNTPVDDDYGKI